MSRDMTTRQGPGWAVPCLGLLALSSLSFAAMTASAASFHLPPTVLAVHEFAVDIEIPEPDPVEIVLRDVLFNPGNQNPVDHQPEPTVLRLRVGDSYDVVMNSYTNPDYRWIECAEVGYGEEGAVLGVHTGLIATGPVVHVNCYQRATGPPPRANSDEQEAGETSLDGRTPPESGDDDASDEAPAMPGTEAAAIDGEAVEDHVTEEGEIEQVEP